MVIAKNVVPKKRGRPATGADPLIAFRSSSALIARIDAYADQIEKSRSEAIRHLVEQALSTASDHSKTEREAGMVRQFGTFKDRITVDARFDEPLPESELTGWNLV